MIQDERSYQIKLLTIFDKRIDQRKNDYRKQWKCRIYNLSNYYLKLSWDGSTKGSIDRWNKTRSWWLVKMVLCGKSCDVLQDDTRRGVFANVSWDTLGRGTSRSTVGCGGTPVGLSLPLEESFEAAGDDAR